LLYQALPHLATHSTYTQRNRRDLLGDTGENARADVLAGDAGILDIFKMKLETGRGFTEDENRGHHKVCVVGHKTAQTLFDGAAFEIRDFARSVNKFDAVLWVMRAVVGFVAGSALLVGGVGVMNMMLVSVSERVREIGIRKAIGASPRDIAAQFLWEAIVLSGSGGVVGIAGGVSMAMLTVPLIKPFRPGWGGVIDHRATTIAFVVSMAIGLIFGFFPARRAARLDAIQAIRT